MIANIFTAVDPLSPNVGMLRQEVVGRNRGASISDFLEHIKLGDAGVKAELEIDCPSHLDEFSLNREEGIQ